jgi:hypothetical protein
MHHANVQQIRHEEPPVLAIVQNERGHGAALRTQMCRPKCDLCNKVRMAIAIEDLH